MEQITAAMRFPSASQTDFTDVGMSLSFIIPAGQLDVRRQLERADSLRNLWSALVAAVGSAVDDTSLRNLVASTVRLLAPSSRTAPWQERQLALNPLDTPRPPPPPPGTPSVAVLQRAAPTPTNEAGSQDVIRLRFHGLHGIPHQSIILALQSAFNFTPPLPISAITTGYWFGTACTSFSRLGTLLAGERAWGVRLRRADP